MATSRLVMKHSLASAGRRLFSAEGNLLKSTCAAAIHEMKAAGTFKEERVITGMQGASVKVVGREDLNVLNFCANNYLGLCDNQELIATAKDTLDKFGYGMSSVRFICGTQTIHKDLEARLAAFHGMEDCILFPSGFDANAGFFEAILGPEDAIISDSLNHASIIDGVRLCKAKRFRYEHMKMNELEAKLQEATDMGTRLKVVVTDGVFSMDGDVAPLKEIRNLCDKFGAYLYVDECHATGFFGPTGRGTPELFGIQPDFISTTLGKALGGATGGYVVSNKEVISVLRNKARTYLFTNTIAPVVAGTSLRVLDMLEDENVSGPLRQQLKDNTAFVRESMKKAGLNVLGHDECPIVPVWLGDAVQAQQVSQQLLSHGIYAVAFSFPVVPKGSARIRFQISAAHTKEQLQKLVDGTVGAAKEAGVL